MFFILNFLLTDQITVSDWLYFLRYWTNVYCNCLPNSLWCHKFLPDQNVKTKNWLCREQRSISCEVKNVFHHFLRVKKIARLDSVPLSIRFSWYSPIKFLKLDIEIVLIQHPWKSKWPNKTSRELREIYKYKQDGILDLVTKFINFDISRKFKQC